MEPGSRTSTVDKLAHFVHQLKTVSPLSSNFNAILTHLRDYLKRHPPQVAGFVHGGGIPVVMKILSRPLPPSPSPQMSESTLNSGSNGDGPSPEATVLLEKALALLNVVSVEESGRRQLSNEGSLRIFLFLMSSRMPDPIRLRSCRCLSALLPNESIMHFLRNFQDFSKLTTALLENSLFHEIVLRIIRQTSTTSSLRRSFFRNKVLSKLSPLLNNDDVGTVQGAIMCIISLVSDPETLVPDVSRQVRLILPQVVQLASHESPGVQQSALDLLTRLTSSKDMRIDMGSKGVIACFLEHLAFDEKQTTVSSMQKKITYALTLCCHDGYNRAKLTDLGGLPVFVGILGSPLYQTVHLHILSCLPEFRHDKNTLQQLISLGMVPLVVRHSGAALDVAHPLPVSEPIDESQNSLDNVHEQSHHNEGEKSKAEVESVRGDFRFPAEDEDFLLTRAHGRVVLSSPAISPPSMTEELRHDLQTTCASPDFYGGSSPVSASLPTSPRSAEPMHDSPGLASESGRYSPVLDPEELEMLQLSPTPQTSSSVKRSHSISSELSSKKTRRSSLQSTSIISGIIMSIEDAKKCLQYSLAFLDAVSYHAEFIKLLAMRSVLSFLVTVLDRGASQPTYQILSRITKDRLSFEPSIRSGLPLFLVENGPCKAEYVREGKRTLLRGLRSIAEWDFGFGELLHLCLRSQDSLRMTCIASAAVLLQSRYERNRMFERNGVLDQLMDVLKEGLDDDEASRLAAQALHAFFLDDVVTNEDIVDLSEETATACWYQESLDTLVENDHKNEGLLCYCNLDDGTVVPVNREAVGQKSEVFAAMLGQNFLEGQVPSIPIKETDSRAFQGIVHFVCGCHFLQCTVLESMKLDETGESLLNLIQLSDQYLLFELRDYAHHTLIYERLKPRNAAWLFQCAEMSFLTSVSEGIVQHVLKCTHFDLSMRSAFLQALLVKPVSPAILTYVRSHLTSRM